jgi:predicted ester cyclase
MEDTLATLHEECVFEDVATGQVFHGHAGAEAYYRMWWDAFDLRFRREGEDRSYWTEDGIGIGEGRFYGKHTGDFLGIPPTAKPVAFRFTVFVTYRDGLMVGERFYYDLAGVLRQIGSIEWPLKLAA